MIERSISFIAPMICAILAGKKTQTRRLVKLPTAMTRGNLERAWPDLLWGVTPGLHVPMPTVGVVERLRNPWGWPEPCRLWVEETWARDDEDGCTMYRSDVGLCDDADAWEQGRAEGVSRFRWRPSIHMPRWASRITLEITGVRAERLQGISEADAEAEGVPAITSTADSRATSYREGFQLIWSSLYGHHSWNGNPWVWVVEFRRVEGGE